MATSASSGAQPQNAAHAAPATIAESPDGGSTQVDQIPLQILTPPPPALGNGPPAAAQTNPSTLPDTVAQPTANPTNLHAPLQATNPSNQAASQAAGNQTQTTPAVVGALGGSSATAPPGQPNTASPAPQAPTAGHTGQTAAQATQAPQAPQAPQTPARRVLAFKKSVLRVVTDCKFFILACAVYIVTVGCTTTVSWRYTPLGSVSGPVGIFLLNLLAKAGDVVYALAVAEALENLQWGELITKSSACLTKYLAVNMSTPMSSLLQISWSRAPTRARTRARSWAIIHALAILIAPGPGLIIMASVDIEPSYHYVAFRRAVGNDTSDINISAGIGPFDPNPTALAVYEDQAVIEFPRLVQGLFRDDKVTYRASPVSAECKEVKKNCSSFLLSGGMGAVKPWPFIGTELLSLDAPQYTITNAPSYHIDFWWAPALDSWGSNDCHLYGANDYRFQLCIKLIDREKGVLLVAWRSCPPLTPPSPLCGRISTYDGYIYNGNEFRSQKLVVYRRSVTYVHTRSSNAIEATSDFGSPRVYTIEPDGLFSVFDRLLWPWNQNSTSFANVSSIRRQVTDQISILLYFSLSPNGWSTPESTALLRNLLFTPVSLFNPLAFSTGNIDVGNILQMQPNLDPEFYTSGYYTKRSDRATPNYGTVLAYAAVAGFILIMVFAAECVAMQYDHADRFPFPALEFGLRIAVRDGHAEVPLYDRLSTGQAVHEVLDQVRDLRIVLKEKPTTSN